MAVRKREYYNDVMSTGAEVLKYMQFPGPVNKMTILQCAVCEMYVKEQNWQPHILWCKYELLKRDLEQARARKRES